MVLVKVGICLLVGEGRRGYRAGRVRDVTFLVWRLLAQLREEGREGASSIQRGGHSLPPSPQEDVPVLQPLLWAQRVCSQPAAGSMSRPCVVASHKAGQRCLGALGDDPNLCHPGPAPKARLIDGSDTTLQATEVG